MKHAVNSSSSSSPPATVIDERPQKSLQEVRNRLHIGLMYTFTLFGLPVVILMLFKWIPLNEWRSVGLGLSFYATVALVTLFHRHLSFGTLKYVGHVIFFAISALTLYYFGLSGPGFWFFISYCVLNAVIYGFKTGMLSLVASTIAIAAIGIGMSTGAIDINLANVKNSLSGASWAVAIMLFLTIAGSMIIAQAIVNRYLSSSYKEEARLRRRLESTNGRLAEQLGELRRTRDQAEEAQRLYRLLAEYSTDVIWQINPERGSLYVSPSVERLLGYTPQELQSLHPKQYMQPESFERYRAAIEQLQLNYPHRLEPVHLELQQVHSYGTVVPVETVLTPLIDTQKEELIILGVTRDISQRKIAERKNKQLEAELRQAQKMEAIGQLAGGIAHDFNNLLTGISGNIELALMELDEGDPLHAGLSDAGRASERAAGLTRQLLAFSRKQILEPRAMALNSLLRETNKMLVRLIGEHIELALDLCDPDIILKADPGQIEQVVFNLVVNARDAMPTGGKLTIRTFPVTPDAQFCKNRSIEPGDYACIEVRDTGHGMNDITLSRIFDPFFTTKPVGKGTGLGLSTVYGVVRQHQGAADVQSAEGKGTTFSIFLPVYDTSETGELPGPRRSQNLPKGSERVMLVEDDRLVRTVAEKTLKRLGYNVITATNGPEALEKADADFDLLITDMVMPKMNGRELAEKLVEQYPSTKVLFTSGYTNDDTIRLGVLRSTINFLSKPYTPETLAGQVRRVLDEKKQ